MTRDELVRQLATHGRVYARNLAAEFESEEIDLDAIETKLNQIRQTKEAIQDQRGDADD